MTADPATSPDVDDTGAAEFDRPSPRVVRLAAAILDFTVVAVVVLVIQLAWTKAGARPGSARVPTTGSNWLSLAVLIGYPVVSVGRTGQTLGKRLLSLKVLRLDGRSVGWCRSIVRFLVAYAPLLAGPLLASVDKGAVRTLLEYAQVGLVAIVYLPILLDDSRRGLHDRVAGTQVRCRVPPLIRAAEQLQREPRG